MSAKESVLYMLNALSDRERSDFVTCITDLVNTMRLGQKRSVLSVEFTYSGETLSVNGTADANRQILEGVSPKYILVQIHRGRVVLVFTYDVIRLPPGSVPVSLLPRIDYFDYVCFTVPELERLRVQDLPQQGGCHTLLVRNATRTKKVHIAEMLEFISTSHSSRFCPSSRVYCTIIPHTHHV